jgi:RNA polymerase sigma-70 factor (ECF subfamily)
MGNGHSNGVDRDTAPDAPRRVAFSVARQAWPATRLSFERFCEHLDGLGHTVELPREVSALYLCAACIDGDAVAWRTLEAAYFPALADCVTRIVGSADLVEDVLQDVRYRLVAQAPPKLATYRGRGSLASWLRAVAVNVALDIRRAGAARRRRELELLAWSAVADEPRSSAMERDSFERRCAEVLDRGLTGAVMKLAAAERNLIHLHVVNGLSIDVLGSVYSVDRSTIARRIRRHFDRVAAELFAQLSAELGQLTRSELAGVWRLWCRYSSIHLERLFSPDAGGATAVGSGRDEPGAGGIACGERAVATPAGNKRSE